VAEIGAGLLVLAGVSDDEQDGETEWLAAKVANIRIFEDEQGKMNRSLLDVGGEVLVVPEFTLYGDARRGRRPSWAKAAQPEAALARLDAFCSALERGGARVRRGAFQEHMEVELVNDGPVSLMIESPPAGAHEP